MLGHKWSGWPGAHCLKCGAEHALENALGNNWVDLVPEGPPPHLGAGIDKWISEDHRALVILADSTCTADLTEPERKAHEAKLLELEQKVKAFHEPE